MRQRLDDLRLSLWLWVQARSCFRAQGCATAAQQLQPGVGLATGGAHFHDLRHTGNTFAASTGVGIKDLMARIGHDSERAAMIYQHQARGADGAITSAIDAHLEAERGRGGWR